MNSFDAWTFYAGTDTNTTGNVLFQSYEAATSAGLVSVTDGTAIVKVDNTTSGAGDSTFGRPSVKIYSNQTVSQGSLVVMDATHVPYGVRCQFRLRSFSLTDMVSLSALVCLYNTRLLG